MEENNKVLLGMSGGTDSSVAAMLLLDAGYEVTGTTFRFFEKDNNTEYLDDARELCSRLGIPHITYDLRDKFKEYIIDYFIKEYMTGRTPVPCNTILPQDITYKKHYATDIGISRVVQTQTKTSLSSYGDSRRIL